MISLPRDLGLRLLHLDRATSTNSVALEAAEAGETGGLVVLADLQTHGRGRQGRAWISPPGTGLCFSLLRRPDVEPSLRPYWTVLAGVAVHDALEDAVPGLWLKWPNDLLVGNSKIAGILCEVGEGGANSAPPSIVVGIGINLRQPPGGWPESLAGRATSVQEAAPPHGLSRGALLEGILSGFVPLEKDLLESGPTALMERYRACMAPFVGRSVSVERGNRLIRADVVGVADSGALEVVDEQGDLHRLLAGDVHLGAL